MSSCTYFPMHRIFLYFVLVSNFLTLQLISEPSLFCLIPRPISTRIPSMRRRWLSATSNGERTHYLGADVSVTGIKLHAHRGRFSDLSRAYCNLRRLMSRLCPLHNVLSAADIQYLSNSDELFRTSLLRDWVMRNNLIYRWWSPCRADSGRGVP